MGRQSTTKKAGTQRLFFCHPCGARHNPPTGLKCYIQMKKSAEAEAATPGNSGGSSHTTRAKRREARLEKSESESDDSPASVTVTNIKKTKAKKKSVTHGKEDTENATEGMLTSIMDQIRIMADEQRKAREVDRADMRAAIDELNRKIAAPILSVEDDTSGDDSREPELSDTLFAAPCRGKRAGKLDTADPYQN